MTTEITVYGTPTFQMGLSSETIRGLCRLAQNHYDGTCQDAARPGGFLYNWRTHALWEDRNNISPYSNHVVTATFRELDLTMKVLEMLELDLPANTASEVNKDSLQEYRSTVSRAMAVANEQVWKGNWRIKL